MNQNHPAATAASSEDAEDAYERRAAPDTTRFRADDVKAYMKAAGRYELLTADKEIELGDRKSTRLNSSHWE